MLSANPLRLDDSGEDNEDDEDDSDDDDGMTGLAAPPPMMLGHHSEKAPLDSIEAAANAARCWSNKSLASGGVFDDKSSGNVEALSVGRAGDRVTPALPKSANGDANE